MEQPRLIKRFLLGVIWASALSTQGVFASFDHDHTLWTHVLSEFTELSDELTLIKYKELKKNSEGFQEYLLSLEGVAKSDYDIFSKDQKLAFLINAYNAFTVKLILDHYPTKSIRKIWLFKNPWKQEFFKLFSVKTHLDHIEHDLIRKGFEEPRIHFAVNCASISCPSLRSEAYVAKRLNEQLEDSTRRFLTHRARNRYERESQTLYLSKLLEWYGEDFVKSHGSVKAFVAPYMASNPKEEETMKGPKTKALFLDYDWDLNEKQSSKK